MIDSALFLAICAMSTSLFASLLSPCIGRFPALQRLSVSLLLAVSGALAMAAGLFGLNSSEAVITLPIGLPWLPMHLHLDALSAFFMLTIGVLLLPVGIYSVGYLKEIVAKNGSIQQMGLFLPLFALGMQGVVLADDAYTFMVFWEIMSLASYFLVTFEHEDEATRKAGFLYLLMAHLAGLLILGAFSVLYAAAGDFSFVAMRNAELSPGMATAAFLLAAFGFGMKAGVVPLHVWLPDAHSAAPSNASALMSGIMLKVAIFGFIRLIWDLVGMHEFVWWWGALVLAAGSSSAITGILMALQQHDLKRLLAYSSVENVGIILIGLGLAMTFAASGHPLIAVLGMIAALYHTINHALFKGMLFMGAGAVMHATGSRDMESMGGLIHRMPVTAVFVLIACISISGLPPFNGFVSEWLTFQTALLTPHLENTLLAALIPFSASMLALAGALAAVCFVKLFGIVFQGQARSTAAAEAHEVDGWMKAGMAIPALFCLLLGVLPTLFIPLIESVPQMLIHTSLSGSVQPENWLWLTPVNADRASYAAPMMLFGMLIFAALIYWRLHGRGKRILRGPVWSCGHAQLNPRMQYTSTSFSQPLKRIFSGAYLPEVHEGTRYGTHPLVVRTVVYAVYIGDLFYRRLYLPIGRITQIIADRVAHEHERGMHAYLAYIFSTILLLLLWVVQ
ncbi:MAG: hydrogenase 4 subunit B [Mariprofundus sp.]|nr:hydrogenase 4 subunit B [Mariprofundus sp.]